MLIRFIINKSFKELINELKKIKLDLKKCFIKTNLWKKQLI